MDDSGFYFGKFKQTHFAGDSVQNVNVEKIVSVVNVFDEQFFPQNRSVGPNRWVKSSGKGNDNIVSPILLLDGELGPLSG